MNDTIPPNDDDGDPGRHGRPTKLTDALFRAFVDLLLRGSFRSTACGELGVAPATFRRWLRNGKAYPEGIYADFRRAVAAAESRAEHQMVARIVAAAAEDWQAAAWLLERKYPHRYGELGELKREVRELEKKMRDLGLDPPKSDEAEDDEPTG
ncbi:hypothetical protein [Limnoglobus roseus]|uniref:Uncharacterized protein n=1 Tax=Limnoglobus roseus TaxID=2598579 RepID=A0A5C1APD1_9BACT|nr:hypothetical protein [Limnoglobus roseus]QEL20445.1 hypothetical protein PX52LOC_07543 [Limnoglobus roseus]